MSDPIQFFIAEIVREARAMPIPTAVRFLHGALLTCGQHEAMEDVKRAHHALVVADDQLELIAGPQMRLPLSHGVDGKTEGDK